MFKKLVSSLSYNPSLLEDMVFYAKRLHQEESIRRLSFVLVVLAMLLQIFAITSPPESSLANSANDIIYGGSTKQDILTAYDTNKDPAGRQDIQAIYSYYGITRQNIVDAQAGSIHHSQGTNLFSTGRYQNSKNPSVDVWTPISGATNGGIYQRPLSIWGDVNFQSISGVNSRGQRFWILLKGCGNIAMESTPTSPKISVQKKLKSSQSVSAGDTVTYEILFRNVGDGIAYDVQFKDTLAPQYEFVSYKSTTTSPLVLSRSGQHLTWRLYKERGTLPPLAYYHSITVTVRVRDNTAPKTKICNVASIVASNHPSVSTSDPRSEACVTVQQELCPGTGLPIPPAGVSGCTIQCPDGSTVTYNENCPEEKITPRLSCERLRIADRSSWDTVTFESRFLLQPGAEIESVSYFVDNILVDNFPLSPSAKSHSFQHKMSEGQHTVRAEIKAKTGVVQETSACSLTTEIVEPPELTPIPVRQKRVSNLTQSVEDADGQTAQAGDELSFTISVRNEGDASIVKQPFVDEIQDILEYADITDQGGADYDEIAKTLSWDPVDIGPGDSVSKTFKARIMNPIPSTPVSASDPLSYDLVIHNDFGNRVTVKLPEPLSKKIESVTTTTLPRTGPTQTIMFISIFVIISGYLYARNKTLALEVDIIKADSAAGGI